MKARHALVRSDQAAEQAIIAMLADDNLGEKLVNIGLPLALASCCIKVGIASIVMHSGKMNSEP
ncbi:hypothetical protein [Alcaligenes faecalis]|uniref:hypothetical protein n=1 Tax=Alcaligenes faecalis TaxID=511 RepID=UPI001931EC82|nr:hypothetical protein [Alcaligenes faecalis]